MAGALRASIRRFYTPLLYLYLLGLSLSLLVGPQWTLKQRWSPLGDPAKAKSLTGYRVLAAACLLALLLDAFPTRAAGIAGNVVWLLIWTAALLRLVAWALVSALRALVGRPVPKRDLRNGGELLKGEGRAASFVAFLIACLATWMTVEAFGGNRGPVLAPYDAFYALPFEERRRVLHERSFEEQVDIYLVGENKCQGSELETEFDLHP